MAHHPLYTDIPIQSIAENIYTLENKINKRFFVKVLEKSVQPSL